VNIFLTIDTEVWEFYDDFSHNFQSSIDGTTDEGCYGLTYLLDVFKKYQLAANFFVEPLFSIHGYEKELKLITDKVNEYHQDIQLHIHTERFSKNNSVLPLDKKANLHQYSLHEQTNIIDTGYQLLQKLSDNQVNCFRAGNYGGNIDTLRALEKLNIPFDTTYNACYLNSACKMGDLGHGLNDKFEFEGVSIFPVSFMENMMGTRHFQLVACSTSEMKSALYSAKRLEIENVVIVLHSFELIQRKVGQTKYHKLDKIVQNRFLNLCQFLSDNRDTFKTQKFSELEISNEHTGTNKTPLKASNIGTVTRLVEQTIRKLK